MSRDHALLSPCGAYRYTLRREVSDALDGEAVCLFVMLNPSTADAVQDDPTIRRCIGFARRWGFGRLAVANLYALRSSDPTVLLAHPDPVGPENDFWIRNLTDDAALTVAAWGGSGPRDGRAEAVLAMLDRPHCLGVTATGAPRHPLYVRADKELEMLA